jgi:hypothetical protein
MDRRWNEEDWEKSVSIDDTRLRYGIFHAKNPNTLPTDSQPCDPGIMHLAAAHKELGTKARQGMTSALADQARLPPLNRVLLLKGPEDRFDKGCRRPRTP